MPRSSISSSPAASGSSGRENRHPGGLRLIQGSRGVPETVVLRTTAALEPALEGIAACDEALASAGRIRLAIEAGSEMAALNEANRMTVRLTAARQELLGMAGAIDTTRPSAA